jgi:DnaK suppressor protein
MDKRDVLFLRNMLLVRRKDILERVNRLAAVWKGVEPAIELEEEAQKASITEPYDRLDESRKNEVEQIDLALSKIAIGDYGICESCGDDISPKRLEALPWARLCVECARDFEHRHEALPRTTEVIGTARLPDSFHDLSNEQIVKLIYDRFHKQKKLEADELRVSVRRGAVYLEGVVPGEMEHQAILNTLTDGMGFVAVVDRLEIQEFLLEREDGNGAAEETDEAAAEELLYDDAGIAEGLYEGHEDEAPFADGEERT